MPEICVAGRNSVDTVSETMAAVLPEGEFHGELWADTMAAYRNECELASMSRHARYNPRAAMKFLAAMCVNGPAGLTSESVAGYLSDRKHDGASQKTLINLKYALSNFCEFLIGRKLLSANPAREVAVSRPHESPPQIVPAGRTGRLLRVARSAGIEVEVIVAIGTGLRVGELAALAWADIDLAGKTLLVRKAKAKLCRVVPLPAAALAAIKRQRVLTRGNAWVFPAKQAGRGWSRYVDRPTNANRLCEKFAPVRKAMPELQQLAGNRVGRAWHALRHTFCTRLVIGQVNLVKIADWAGHSDLNMTRRYVRLARQYDSDIERAIG